MIRNVTSKLSGRREPSLPGSYNASPSAGFFSSRNNDGSAKSIHTAPTLKEFWRRLSLERKITFIAITTSLLMIWFGWRSIRYTSAGISISCHAQTCDIFLRPYGWGKVAKVNSVSKYQLQLPKAIKTYKNGDYITDQDVTLTERVTTDAKPNKKKAKYQKKKEATYKGPDEQGRYTTYAIILTDKQHTEFPEDAEIPDNHQAVDLSKILHLMDRYVENGKIFYRIIPRKFGVQHSKRRIRTMIQKLESYIRRRRVKAVIKEDSPPSWQGVLLMVFGFTGLLITLILGQFSMASSVSAHHQSGPGVRRQRDPFRTTTPSKYEVSTKPNLSAYRRSNAPPRKRN